jgi:hypothetical protein
MKSKLSYWRRLHPALFTALSFVLAVVVLGGVVFAAVYISNVWHSPDVNVVNQTILASSDWLTEQTVSVGSVHSFNVTLWNHTSVPVSNATLYLNVTTSECCLAACNVSVSWSMNGTWHPLELTGNCNTLTGNVTTLSLGANETTVCGFEASFNVAGVYSFDVWSEQ